MIDQNDWSKYTWSIKMRISKYIILYFCGGSLIPHSPHSSEISARVILNLFQTCILIRSLIRTFYCFQWHGYCVIISSIVLLASPRSCLGRFRLAQIPNRLDRNYIFHFDDAALKRFWSARFLECPFFCFFRPTKQK